MVAPNTHLFTSHRDCDTEQLFRIMTTATGLRHIAWLMRYSPYHNIRVGVNMPTMLVIAGENDTRVDPLHAKKFVAKAQANIGQSNPVMLKMDYDSGHGSGKSTAQLVEDCET